MLNSSRLQTWWTCCLYQQWTKTRAGNTDSNTIIYIWNLYLITIIKQRILETREKDLWRWFCTHTDWPTVETSSGRWRRGSWGRAVWGPGRSWTWGSPSDLQKQRSQRLNEDTDRAVHPRADCAGGFIQTLLQLIFTLAWSTILWKRSDTSDHQLGEYFYFIITSSNDSFSFELF